MQESYRHWPLSLLCLLLLLPASWSCDLPQSGSSSQTTTSSSGEAEKTRRMEELAAEIERDAEAIRNMQGTEQEKIDAMNRLEEKRRQLNEMQDNP
jgi:hypothetical protein